MLIDYVSDERYVALESTDAAGGSWAARSRAMTGAPYRVRDAGHWAFAGTGLTAGDTFGEKCLHRRCPGGASGHETDKVSPSSPGNVRGLVNRAAADAGRAARQTRACFRLIRASGTP